MVVPTPPITRLSIQMAGGQVHADFVPAEELDRLRAEVESLREQLARAERQRDTYIAELARLLKSSIPIPPSEEEMREAVANPNELAGLIAELEAR
jgi:outer membrane protein TolC